MYQNYIAVGRTTRDVEIRYGKSGVAVGNFGLAINKKIKKNEEWVEETTFLDCVVFGKNAENMSEYVKKGRLILINGELRNDNWVNKDGEKRSRLEVIVNDFRFLNTGNNQKIEEKVEIETETENNPSSGDNDIPF